MDGIKYRHGITKEGAIFCFSRVFINAIFNYGAGVITTTNDNRLNLDHDNTNPHTLTLTSMGKYQWSKFP